MGQVNRTRQMFIGQRPQTINTLQSHLSEHGVITPKSKAGIKMPDNSTFARLFGRNVTYRSGL